MEQKTSNKELASQILDLYLEASEAVSMIRKTIRGHIHEETVNHKFKGRLKASIDSIIIRISFMAVTLGSNMQGIVYTNIDKINNDANDINEPHLQIDEDFAIDEYISTVQKTYRNDLPGDKKDSEERKRFFGLGLIKEIGKVAELYGKCIIDKTELNTKKVMEKLGDTLWYLTAIYDAYGLLQEETLGSDSALMPTEKHDKEAEEYTFQNGTLSFENYQKQINMSFLDYMKIKTPKARNIEFILGLFEEAAEVTEIINTPQEQQVDIAHLEEELGDVLWYLSFLANHLGTLLPGNVQPGTDELRAIAFENLIKVKAIEQSNTTQESPNLSNLDFYFYQKMVGNTYREDLPKGKDDRGVFFSVGLVKEIGKLADLFGEYQINDKKLDVKVAKEKIGDALWYFTAIADTYELNINTIAQKSIGKVLNRIRRTKQPNPSKDGPQSEIVI